MFDYLRRNMFYLICHIFHPEVKRPSAMDYILSNFEISENRYKEVTSSISGYQDQSKGARVTMKIRY